MAVLTDKNVRQIRAIVRDEVADIREKQRRQGVLLKVVQSDLKTVLEILSANLPVKSRVDNHEQRLVKVETT